MLGWFKKKFSKKKDDAAVSAADLKIPVAPRDFGTGTQPTVKEPVIEEVIIASEVQESAIEDSSQAYEDAEEKVEPSQDVETPADLALDQPEDNSATGAPDEETAEAPVEESLESDIEPESIEQAEAPATEQIADTAVPEPEPEEIAAAIPEEHVEIPEHDTVDLEVEAPIEVAEITSEDEEEKSQKIPVTPVRIPIPQDEDKTEKTGTNFLSRLSEKLTRSRESFTYQLDTLFLGKKEIDSDLLDDLEELLITADLGVSTTQEILDHARKKVKRNELSNPASLKEVLKAKLKSFIIDYHKDAALVMPEKGPFVIMVVGVNGVGKTTTIGKIAHKFVQSGQSVLLVAADTFRAAAISQLKIWGERNNVPVLSQAEGTDPSSVVYDAIAHAKAKDYDVVLVDTAGRLHTQSNLMTELTKIKRVMAKQLPGSPHEVMLVIDATTGQNGISQAKLFDAAVDLTGITLTKLDGTAKGGIVANISKELKLPIRFIGVGEQLEDLRDFDPDEFIEALFESDSTKTE